MTEAALAVVEQPPEQTRYAQWLEWGSRVGVGVLLVTFAAYMLGWLPALVAPQRLPELWGLPVAQYLQQSAAPIGWSWLAQLRRGDVAAMSGIAILAACSVPALLAIVPMALRRGDKVLAGLCLAEVLVVVAAASGWLTGGH